jgi:hypothetical protein
MIYHKTLNHIGTAILLAGVLLVPMKFLPDYVPDLPLESVCMFFGAFLMGVSRRKWEQKVKLPAKWQHYLTQV